MTWLRDDPLTWDPHRISKSTHLRWLNQLVFGMLGNLAWPEEGECGSVTYVPDQAESWRWVGDTTLEVKLRPGTKFHNKAPVSGREVTAEDAAFSFNRLKGSLAFAANFMKPVTSIEAADRYTVLFKTTQPYAPLVPLVVASNWGGYILAKESGGAEGRWEDPSKSYIGSGPFIFRQWSTGVNVLLDKNPDYFKKGLPHVDRVRLIVIQDWGPRMAALKAGKLDFSFEIPSPLALELQKSRPDIVLKECPHMGGGGYLAIRTDLPPFNDVRLRRAVAMAIDQNAIIKAAQLGKGVRSGAVQTTMMMAMKPEEFHPEVRQYLEYHPDRTKKLLAEAGYPSGLDVEIHASRVHGSPYNEIYEAVDAMMNAAGIRTKIVWLEYAVATRTVFAGQYPQMGFFRAGAIIEPYEGFGRFRSTAGDTLNTTHVNDATLDKLIDQFYAAVDEKKATELAREIQIRIVDQVYWYRFPNVYAFAAHHPYVKNFGGSGYSEYVKSVFENVRLDK